MARMTNEEAILRLAQDEDDAVALLAVADNSSESLKAAVKRYFVGRARRKRALFTLLVHVSWHAKEFVRGRDASQWMEAFAEAWCKSWTSEATFQPGETIRSVVEM